MPPIAVSKSKLLSFSQCPRRVWLETYSPELEQTSADTSTRLATGRSVGELARELYGRGAGQLVSFERGLRAAVESTRALLAAGGSEPIFEATFDFAGLGVRVDVLDRSESRPKIVEVKSSTSVKEQHLLDCAIQAFALTQLGLAPRQIAVATIDNSFVYAGDGNYAGLLAETDVTDLVHERMAEIPALVAAARDVLESLDEPNVQVGTQCKAPYGCDFYSHCAPPPSKYPVLGLGGSKEKLFALMHAGHGDIRDVPEDALATDLQRRIHAQTRREAPYVGEALRTELRALPYPRFYLDFETIGFAVPRFAGTRPYEALPFQWSCHIDRGTGELTHREFLDVSGTAPMRAAANTLIGALGETGPVLVYTPYERGVLNGLAARYADLAPQLEAIAARLVDLHPPLKQHYYHPAMQGSWSIKAVLPTIAPELAYARLGEVQDGMAAQSAYLEAIDAGTTPARRDELSRALRVYCGHDTLALARLVEHFSQP